MNRRTRIDPEACKEAFREMADAIMTPGPSLSKILADIHRAHEATRPKHIFDYLMRPRGDR